MCQAKLIMQMPHDLWGALEIIVFADELKGPFNSTNAALALPAASRRLHFRESFSLAGCSRRGGRLGTERSWRDQIQEPFLRGLHDRWW